MLLDKILHADAFDVLPRLDDESVDLIICDGPYGVTANDWDRVDDVQDFNLRLIEIFSRKMKKGAALYLFGKPDCVDFIDYRPYLNLRSKIVWYQPSRLAQGRISYTNNHDVICYFIKGGRPRAFDLDAVRVPQLVELEHRLRCERVPSVADGKFGKTKFNEKGKNPGDVKQLTYRSKELVSRTALNTIQKPEKLMERLIKASSKRGDMVLDPFAGVGASAVVCRRLDGRFIAVERDAELARMANARLARA